MFEQIKQAFGIGVDPNAMNETYGVPESVVRQARGNQMAQLGANIYAMSQQLTPSQRAQVAQNMASQGNDFQKNIYNAAQSRLMQQRIELANQKDAREREALARLQEIISALPDDDPRKVPASVYLQYGDGGKAAEVLAPRPSPRSAFSEKREALIESGYSPEEATRIAVMGGASIQAQEKPPAGYRWDESGTALEAIPGGPATKQSAETSARTALAATQLDVLDDEFIAQVEAGGVTGFADILMAKAGRGKQGEIMREINAASEAMVRMLTGAGMNMAEAQREAELYIPTFTDDGKSAASKLRQLKRRLKATIDAAGQGRGGGQQIIETVRQGAETQPPAQGNQQQMILQEARDAISRGADRAAVIERLRQMGVSAEGL